MSTFRLLVFANATVAHNQKLSCAATTMRELEQAVQAELGLGFPVWIFQRDPDFGDDFVKVTDLADMSSTSKIEVRPQTAGSPRPAGPSVAPAAPAAGGGGTAPRKFMLLIASNELVRTTKKVVATASTLDELSEHVMGELGLGLDAGMLTKPAASAAAAVPIETLSQVKDKDKLMVWPRPRAAPAPAPVPAPMPVRVAPAAAPKEFTLLLCKSELVGATNKHFKTSAKTLEELVGKVQDELGTSETPVLCLQGAGGVRGAAITNLDELPAKAKVQVVTAATLNPDVMTAARAVVKTAGTPVRAAGTPVRAAAAVVTAKPAGSKRSFVLLVGANDLVPSSKRADVQAATIEELEQELSKQFNLGSIPIMVVKHGQTMRLTDLATMPSKAKVQILRAPGAAGAVRAKSATSMASVASTVTVAKRVAAKTPTKVVTATVTGKVASSPRVVTATVTGKMAAGSPRVVTAAASPRTVATVATAAVKFKKPVAVAVAKKPGITLMLMPNKLVQSKQRLDLTAKDLGDLTAQVAKSVGQDPDDIFISEFVDNERDAKPYSSLAALGSRAKIQIWPNIPDEPDEGDDDSDEEVDLIPGTDWTELFDDDGTPYYYHVETEETVWDAPEEVQKARGQNAAKKAVDGEAVRKAAEAEAEVARLQAEKERVAAEEAEAAQVQAENEAAAEAARVAAEKAEEVAAAKAEEEAAAKAEEEAAAKAEEEAAAKAEEEAAAKAEEEAAAKAEEEAEAARAQAEAEADAARAAAEQAEQAERDAAQARANAEAAASSGPLRSFILMVSPSELVPAVKKFRLQADGLQSLEKQLQQELGLNEEIAICLSVPDPAIAVPVSNFADIPDKAKLVVKSKSLFVSAPTPATTQTREFLLMLLPNKTLPSTKKVKCSAVDMAELLTQIGKQVGVSCEIVLSAAVADGAAPTPYESIDDIPSKARCQIWEQSYFETKAAPPPTQAAAREFTLMFLQNDLLDSTKKLKCSAVDMQDLVSQVSEQFGVPSDVVLSTAVGEGEDPEPFQSLDDIPGKAKLQIWPSNWQEAAAAEQAAQEDAQKQAPAEAAEQEAAEEEAARLAAEEEAAKTKEIMLMVVPNALVESN
eukprot:COSAG06_NODE_3127_length_5809_cov_6.626970_3_plen_1100_part_01